jgi:TM2 domain-containing membrane protein YozV
MAVFAYEMRPHLSFCRDYRDLPTLFAGVLLAIMLVFFGVTTLLDLPTDPLPLLFVSLLPALFALLGAALFVVRAFDGSAEGSEKAMLTLPMAAFGVFYALYLSMENTLLLNAPQKLIGITAWVAAAFFFLGEARIALGRAKWALHTFSTVVTVIFTATLSIPNLAYQAAEGTPLLGNTAHDFVALGVCFYALARLFATVFSELRKEAPGADLITDTKTAPAEEEASAEEETSSEEPNHEEATDR